MGKHEKRDLLTLFQAWQNDILSDWNIVIGYSEWLLTEEDGPLTESQLQILQLMIRASWRAVEKWHNRNVSIALKYDEVPEYHAIDFAKTVNEACSYLRTYFDITNIQVQVPENLPDIKGSLFLERAVSNLLLCPFSSPPQSFPASVIEAHFDEKLRKIKVGIRVSVPDKARRIIGLYRTELEIRETGDLITFSFELPVWNE